MGLEKIPTHGEAACNAVCQVMMGCWCSRPSGKGAEAVEGCLCAARAIAKPCVRALCGADGVERMCDGPDPSTGWLLNAGRRSRVGM